MLPTVLWSVLIVAVVGLAVKLCLDFFESEKEISWAEYGIGLVVVAFILAPAIASIGWKVARNNLVSFEEYWNGWETMASQEDIACMEDGSCRHCYDCDPYIVMVECNCSTDKDGRRTCSECPETRYHSCPYSDTESNYTVETTLRGFSVAGNRFPLHPQSHRWRQSESIPEDIIVSAGVGSAVFLACRERSHCRSPPWAGEQEEHLQKLHPRE